MLLPADVAAIAERLATNLPGEVAHLEMLPYREATSDLLKTASDYRESAVAILLYHENNSLKTVLIERPKYDGTHSGQMAFPGGKKDESDPDLVFTALREMHEEIGFHNPNIHFVGSLTKVYIPVSRFLVYPNVFYSPFVYPFTPDKHEVADIITFGLEELTNSENLSSIKIKLDNGVTIENIPCFKIQNRIIWGATALIMNELRMILK